MSWEIEEIEEDSKSDVSNKTLNDVYVAVGKNDLHVVQWTLDQYANISPGIRICLVHVFPPLTYIPTPVGKLSRSQLSQQQVQAYMNEEGNKRKILLEKYIRLCNDAKVAVDTVLVESNSPAKALLDLIAVVNVTSIVIGTKRRFEIRVMKGHGVGEYVQKNAPEFCEVKVVEQGKKIKNGNVHTHTHPGIAKHSDRKLFECMCFSGKSSIEM